MLQSCFSGHDATGAASADVTQPFARRSEENGRFVYVLSDAVTKYGTGRDEPGAPAEETPVPPCIKARAEPAGCQIAVEIEDRADKASVLKVRKHSVEVCSLQECPSKPPRH
jgi:hypothetical protein